MKRAAREIKSILKEAPELVEVFMDAAPSPPSTGEITPRSTPSIFTAYVDFYKLINRQFTEFRKTKTELDVAEQVRLIEDYENNVTTALLYINMFIQRYERYAPVAVVSDDPADPLLDPVDRALECLKLNIRATIDARASAAVVKKEDTQPIRLLGEIMLQGARDVAKHTKKYYYSSTK